MTQTLEQLSAAATEGEYDKQVQLWFFRELTSDQRLTSSPTPQSMPRESFDHDLDQQRLPSLPCPMLHGPS